MNFFSRHKNTVVLTTVLLAQFLALAVQVKRQTVDGPVRLIRLLTVSAIAPFERLFIYSGESVRGVWSDYLDLRSVRSENLRLQAEVGRMQLERAREREDARQARRIQALLQFKENWIDTTVAAQVIGTSGTESSRLLYLDKGTKDGVKPDMPVITPDGVVGKVLSVYGDTAQVLLLNDPTSGVGALLVTSRLQGVVKGTSTGELQLNYIMGDESVQPGDTLVTAGGDQVFPKGLPIGTVTKVSMGHNLFLDIKLKPAADLNRLEEVLVITAQKARAPDTTGLGPIRAADILAGHLPGVPQTPPQTPAAGASPQPQNAQPQTAKPQTAKPPATPAVKPPQTAKPASAPQTAKPVTGAAATPAGPNAAPVAAAPRVPQPAPKPATPKPAAPKPLSPNTDAKPKPAPTEGTHPQ